MLLWAAVLLTAPDCCLLEVQQRKEDMFVLRYVAIMLCYVVNISATQLPVYCTETHFGVKQLKHVIMLKKSVLEAQVLQHIDMPSGSTTTLGMR